MGVVDDGEDRRRLGSSDEQGEALPGRSRKRCRSAVALAEPEGATGARWLAAPGKRVDPPERGPEQPMERGEGQGGLGLHAEGRQDVQRPACSRAASQQGRLAHTRFA